MCSTSRTPLGEGSGPNAAAVLAAAIGDCLAASFAFCLRKVRLEPLDINAEVVAHVARNEQGRFRIKGIDVELAPEVIVAGSSASRAMRAALRGLLHRHRKRPARHSRQRESGGAQAGEGDCMNTMKAVVFRGKGQIAIEDVPKPVPGPGEAVIKITATTICGTDVHIVRGEYPVKPGLVLGHEPVGVIEELGAGMDQHYRVGERVIVGAITPCGQCFYCLNGSHSQCGGPLGGWRFGNTINGAWSEYLLVPDARANLAPIPSDLDDESVLMCPDIFSTGLSGAESGNIKVGDSVAIFAQGPIGLCATLGAKLRGAGLIIGIDAVPGRLDTARRFGAT